MSETTKMVDGFKFMPPSLRKWICKDIPEEEFKGDIPWTPLEKPVSQTRFALVTSAGINMKADPPFDMEREKREPTWGDPGIREIPISAGEEDIDANHLHINTDFIKQDINVMLPIHRFSEFASEGIIGSLAPTSYSYYGFQLDPTELMEQSMPKIVSKMKEEEAEAVLLTPA